MNRNINFPLLDRIIDQIEKHPETWEQENYRCKSGMCVAGWAVEMSGDHSWMNPEDLNDDRVIRTSDPDRWLDAFSAGGDILGLTYMQADELFYYGNKLEDIKRFRREFDEV